jgi:hypothetical protein
VKRRDLADGREASGDTPEQSAESLESVRFAVAGELRLLDPETRASPALVSALLHPDFVEFGASGRRWDSVSVLSVTTPEPGAQGRRISVEGMAGQQIAPDVVHLTYVSDDNGRRVRRSSLWFRTPGGWRLYFHQGTPADEA